MPIAVTGSLATDHLTAFPGRIAEQLITQQLERALPPFPADRLESHTPPPSPPTAAASPSRQTPPSSRPAPTVSRPVNWSTGHRGCSPTALLEPSHEQAARLACLPATTAPEPVGTQDHKLLASDPIARLGQTYTPRALGHHRTGGRRCGRSSGAPALARTHDTPARQRSMVRAAWGTMPHPRQSTHTIVVHHRQANHFHAAGRP